MLRLLALLAFLPLAAHAQAYPPFVTPLVAGDCLKVAGNGFQGQSSGAPCGVGSISAGTQNQLAWYAATGRTISGLATANNGTLVTSAGGVPSISSTLPAAVQANITGTGTLVSGSSGAGFTLALGVSTVTGTLPGANGGTGVANSGKTITLGGSLTLSGAFTTTLTVGADTALTLPASGTVTALGNSTTGTGALVRATAPTVTALSVGSSLTGADGALMLATVAVAATAPGALGGKVEFVCGTAAGSLKLVAYGGTSATPTTLADNIGSGADGC